MIKSKKFLVYLAWWCIWLH